MAIFKRPPGGTVGAYPADFWRAEDADGMSIDEFDTYGADVRTLRGLIASYHELTRVIREDLMLPNPDVK